MIKAVFPGSFDPVTKGHINLIERASTAVDLLFVAVLVNPAKKTLFSIEERKNMLKEAVKHLPNVEIISFEGLLAELVKQENISFIIKGVRNLVDFESEYTQANINRLLSNGVETLLLPSDPRYSAISSTVVKEIASFNGDLDSFVPQFVVKALKNKINIK
ncbi:MAG: pantetheine-phosphate adenylyltransferase [Eubacteriales bacterium]|nr:pantetheine-phosphate adenylyltransferase [Eubacteriales bacterium]